jgi:hypothetical protein
MTVEEVRHQKDTIRLRILDMAREFSRDTGCLLELHLTYPRINTSQAGADAPQFTYVGRYEVEVGVRV